LVTNKEEPIVRNHAATAVDIAESVFEVAVSIQPGRVKERKTLSRSKFLLSFATRPATTIVMEACGSSHYLVSPYVVRNKTNRTDAKGILEAYRNEEIHPVPIKSVHQHTVMSLHRARSAWMQARTAKVVPLVHEYIGDAESDCPDALRPTLDTMCREIRELEASIRATEAQLERLAKDLPIVAQLRSIPGIGLLTATKKQTDHLRTWALAKASSRGPHKGATAVANKLARIVWAVWSRNDTYHSLPVAT
jgi:transposase